MNKIQASKLYITVIDLTIYVECGMGIGLLGRKSQQRRSDFLLLEGLLGINDTWYRRRSGSITDFNEFKEVGYMFVDKVQSMDNKPKTSSNYGFLETIAINDVTLKQTHVDFQSRFFIRVCNNGTWTDWKQMQTT